MPAILDLTWIVMLSVFCIFPGLCLKPYQYSMDENCNDTLWDFVFLAQEREILFQTYEANVDCQLAIHTPIFSRLVFKLTKVDFLTCSDTVDIYNQNITGDIIASGVCTDSDTNIFVAESESSLIRFQSGATGHTGGFTILATIFYYPAFGYCTLAGFTKCQNERCISHVLDCNGRDNCGDYSDESDCLVWVYILIGVLLPAIAGGVGLFVGIMHCQKRQRQRMQAQGGQVFAITERN